jgi:hypothetical protein
VYRTATKLIACLSLVALGVPAVAQASPRDVILDCADDGQLDRKHSQGDLRTAQGQLPTDIDEYSDCREVIAGAITSGSDKGKGRDGGSGGSQTSRSVGAAPARKRERAAKANDAAALERETGRKPRVSVGGKEVEPGDNGLFNLSSANNGMPLPLLLGLIAAALLVLGGATAVLKRRAPAFASRIPLLSKLSLPGVRLPRLLRR